MVAEEGARLAAHELGLDAPPVHLVRHEKSERISPFQSSLLVPIFLLYGAETWTKEVRMYNFGRLIEIPSAAFRNLNKSQIDRQFSNAKINDATRAPIFFGRSSTNVKIICMLLALDPLKFDTSRSSAYISSNIRY